MSHARTILRRSTVLGKATPVAAPIYVDSDDNKLKMIPAGSGTTEVEIIDASTSQTLTNKTLTAPTLNSPQFGGAAAGAAGAVGQVINRKTVTDNTATDFLTVTVPNVLAGGSLDLLISSALGDGDSTDTARYTVGISRIAGAAAKAVISSKSVVGATAGATANAVITAAISAIAGAVGAVNTFTVTIKNARSAGAADNHPTTVVATLINQNAAGITFAAA